jgi:hypothetical protein
MNILIICYCYPPDLGPRASRWSAIAEYWATQGHKVHVISAGILGALPEETLNGVQVHRVGGTISDKLRRWLKKEAPRSVMENAGQETSGKKPSSGLSSFIESVHDLTWKKLYWPESNCLWFFPARAKALKLASDIPFDAVISTSTPYTGHLVGKTVKIAHPDMPWTVDIGDPFSFGQPPWNNTGLYKKLNYRSEAKVLKTADSISVTVDSCKKAYGQLFSGVEDKITVIPPLFSGAIPSYQKKPNTQKRCQLVFTGSLYKEIRNPAYLLKFLSGVIEQAPETEAHFYGRINDCSDLFEPYLRKFPKNFFVHGLVSREAAASALEEADVLINIANRTQHQLPSKLVDYIASGKPILNIVSIEDDNSLSFLSSYPIMATVMESSDQDYKGDIDRVCNFITNLEMVSKQMIERLLQPFQVPAVEAQYRKLFIVKENSGK